MKPFNQQNFYEILDVPYNARPSEIRDAYKVALDLYQTESLASYSFFTEEERAQILAKLEVAFVTLIDNENRLQYDEGLIRRGKLTRDMQIRKSRPEPIFISNVRSSTMVDRPDVSKVKKIKTKAASSETVASLLEKEVITGEDLKRMRTELGLSLDIISGKTKVRTVFLRAIEEDLFDELPSRFHLKSFLKAYLQCFSIDPQPVAEKYLKRIEG